MLEAESGLKKNINSSTSALGFTGTGFAVATSNDNKLTLTYNAPVTGTYILELKYAVIDGQPGFSSTSTIINEGSLLHEFTFWETGNPQAWVWDKIQVKLSKGKQSISFTLPTAIKLDHVNILQP